MLRTIWLTMENEARLLVKDPIVVFMLLKLRGGAGSVLNEPAALGVGAPRERAGAQSRVEALRDSAGEGRSPSSLGAAQAPLRHQLNVGAQRGGTQRSRGGAPGALLLGRGRSPRAITQFQALLLVCGLIGLLVWLAVGGAP